MLSTVNTNNPAVKRILQEARELAEAGPNADFAAAPLEDNLFEWHFTIRGPKGTAFEGGRYHGHITLPPEYPFKPPKIALLNASGRFEVGKHICLSVSAHHPEEWQPAWGIRTIITALIGFFPSKSDGALAGLDYPDAERRTLARKSLGWRCAKCEVAMIEALPEPEEVGADGDGAAGGDGGNAACGIDTLGMVAALLVGAIAFIVMKKLSSAAPDASGGDTDLGA